MSFAEALNPAPLPALPVYVSYLNARGITTGNNLRLYPSSRPPVYSWPCNVRMVAAVPRPRILVLVERVPISL